MYVSLFAIRSLWFLLASQFVFVRTSQYLSGILTALEQANCASEPIATSSNGWMQAFNAVYETVATDCHLPQGKNRHHKFKDKIVELWNEMEKEVNSKNASMSHPLYALGMKQLDTYRSVARLSSEKAKRSSMGVKGSGDSVSESVTEKEPARKKPRKTITTTTTMMTTVNGGSGEQPALIQVMQKGFATLEHLALQQLPQRLPSPLHDLYKLRRHALTSKNLDTLTSLDPYYSDAVGTYLSQVTSQANSSAHPAMLPGVLEALELLQQMPSHSAQLDESIKYTYKHVLQAYLKLLNPRLENSRLTLESRRKANKKNDNELKDDELPPASLDADESASV